MSDAELAERAARAGLRLPSAVTIAITGACNLRCRHCWVEAGMRGSACHAPGAGVLRLVDGFAALGADTIWITGGEPLLHPEWSAILSHCCARPSIRAVGLQTNATLLDGPQVARLRALPLEKLRIQVSLDGASPRTHDRVRGAGSFAEAMAGVTRLVAAGLGGRTTIAFTEMCHNMEDVPELLELVDRLRLRDMIGGTLVRAGSAERNALQPPTPAQYRALLSLYHASASFRERYDRSGTCSAIEWWRGRSGARGDPCTFFDHPYVSAEGNMYPCKLCHADELAVTRAFETPLADALREAIPRWHELLRLARSRPTSVPECQGCAAKLQCAGGCIGRTLATSGTLAATEDRCELRKAVHVWDAGEDGDDPSAERVGCGQRDPSVRRVSR